MNKGVLLLLACMVAFAGCSAPRTSSLGLSHRWEGSRTWDVEEHYVRTETDQGKETILLNGSWAYTWKKTSTEIATTGSTTIETNQTAWSDARGVDLRTYILTTTRTPNGTKVVETATYSRPGCDPVKPQFSVGGEWARRCTIYGTARTVGGDVETFTDRLYSHYRVEAVETVSVPAGAYSAYRIANNGTSHRVTGTGYTHDISINNSTLWYDTKGCGLLRSTSDTTTESLVWTNC